jgi:thymidine kinase
VLVDEAQFLTPEQIDQLFWFAVDEDIPVLTYGLRSDFKTNGFPGSSRLLELAHELQELKTICRCGRKAVFNGRKTNGQFIASGSQVAIEGENQIDYESLCGSCYKKLVLARSA